MRLGRNERKVHTPLQPAPVTAVVVTHAPEETGYYQNRLEVIRLTLTSLVKNADLPLDLMVFDNASCVPVVDMLREMKDQGLIQYLILSAKNVGLAGAYRIISGAAPGEMIAFSNDDVLFFPNWLSPLVEIMDSFPDAGFVSGFYLRGTFPQTAELARQKGLDVTETPAPDEWVEMFCRDTDHPSVERYLQAQASVGCSEQRDLLITSNGVQAYHSGVYWQGLFNKQLLQNLQPDRHPKEMGFSSFDQYMHSEIVRRGYLRLGSPKPLARHIGNVITPEVAELAASFGITAQPTVSDNEAKRQRHPLMLNKFTRKLVIDLYNYLYRIVTLEKRF